MKSDDPSDSLSVTEVKMPDGIYLEIDWDKKELTIELPGRTIDISSKSRHVVVGKEPEVDEL